MFHERLRQLRAQAGLTQLQLAVKAGLGLTCIHTLEAGRGQPSLPTLRKLAAALEVSLDDLAGQAEAVQAEAVPA